MMCKISSKGIGLSDFIYIFAISVELFVRCLYKHLGRMTVLIWQQPK